MQPRLCWAANSSIDFSLLFRLSGVSQVRNNCTALISKCHNLCVPRVRLTRKCSFHLNNVIQVDLHLKREREGGQLWSLWTFRDYNMKFSSEVKWMWTAACAPQIESFNYFSVAFWFSTRALFMTVSHDSLCQFWQAKAKYWSHKTYAIKRGERLTLQINWSEIIMLQGVTLTVENSCCDEPNCCNTNTHMQMWDVYLVSFPWCIVCISWEKQPLRYGSP